MYDPDELDEEQRERQLRKKLNEMYLIEFIFWWTHVSTQVQGILQEDGASCKTSSLSSRVSREYQDIFAEYQSN